MSISDLAVRTIDGTETTIGAQGGTAYLVVNVASRCGLTFQYSGLEKLQKTYADRGLKVLGFPCNQFGEQEPGSNQEIQTFCSTRYGVSFPMFDKVEVNGPDRHPVYAELSATADAEGTAGDIQWNFEKFLVSAGGRVLARFRPMTTPEDPALIVAIESAL